MNDLVKLVIMLEVQTKMLKVLLNKCIQNLKEQEDIYGRTLNWFYNTFYFPRGSYFFLTFSFFFTSYGYTKSFAHWSSEH